MPDRGLQAEVLVNNAGFGVPGMLCDVPWERHRACLEVMAAAPVRLCHLLAPAMMAGGRGRIVNVSSLSALLPPHAGGTLYYPVKSFLLQFSLAFHAEMRPHGVRVSAVCPGFTETGFQAAAGGTVEKVAVPRWLWSRPGDVAGAALAPGAAAAPRCRRSPLRRARRPPAR
ncbi:SDR family NAD(P)-dependent oxidoreductase [Mangrovicoccus ximenensis]|uniref:SDR family NAD(P)-dependent oxidoreductase n=1 Tax=Mangrovicoccus ximenensis TaxID=1911570 RepID=UPI000D333CA3|nr:SDR family NAD(P)-dependent oxidoreductase [Mangrovicoccus ximenensis]